MDVQIIVFDVEIPLFQNNRIFDRRFAAKYPGALLASVLYEKAASAGWDMMTADVFLSKRPGFSRAVCLSNETTPMLSHLIKAGVEPKVLNSGESPNVAWKFYHELASRSEPFQYAVLFYGANERCKSDYFEQFYWPCSGREMEMGLPWNERMMLCMVVSCKGRSTPNWANWRSRCIQPIRDFNRKIQDWIDPFLKVEDLYETRLRAIEEYAKKSDFQLYGEGWDAAIRYWPRFKRVSFANAPKVVVYEEKTQVLFAYKFALCYENCVFPGYITEKIFDGLFGGGVPIYYGAPDITDYVPQDCFIDARQFGSFSHLWDHIASMTKARWEGYRECIRDFLASERFEPFKDTVIADKYFNWLTKD